VDDTWLVVGLGNPGPSYAAHRHNVGHMVLDVLAGRVGGSFKAHRRARSDVLEGRLGGVPGQRVVLAEPRAYVNESGGPVSALLGYYEIRPQRMVVVHDELDIPYLSLRVKFGGGDNGHNGLKSIRRSIGTGEYHRVRFGIGRPPGRQDPAAFVLRDFSAAERKELDWAVDRSADCVESLVCEGLERTQNQYNS